MLGDRRNFALLAFLLVLSAVPRIVLYTGFFGQDDYAYILAAQKLRNGELGVPDDQFETRTGLVLPLTATAILTGSHPRLWPLYCFLCSLGTVAVAFAIGTSWFGRTTGAIAGVLVAFFPNNIHFAGVVHVDVASAFWCGLAFLLLWPRGPWAEAAAPLRSLAAGLSLGWAYLVKETSLFVAPWLAIWFVAHRASRKALACAAIGLAIVAAAEAAAYTASGRTPAHRVRSSLGTGHVEDLHVKFFSRGSDLARRLTVGYPSLMLNPLDRGLPYLGLLYPYLVAAIALLVWRRTRAWGFLLGWWAIPVALIVYTPGSVRPWVPALSLTPRYLELVTIPAVLLVARALAEVPWRPALRAAAVVPFALAGLAGAAALQRDASDWVRPAEVLRREILARGVRRVKTDAYTERALRVLDRFRPRYALEVFTEHEERDVVIALNPRGVEYLEYLLDSRVSYAWASRIPGTSETLFEERIELSRSWRGGPRGAYTIGLYRR